MDGPLHKTFLGGVPFLEDLGLEFLRMENGEAEVALDLQRRHTNIWNVMHGGVVMTLLDVAMAMASSSLDPELRGGVTVDMNISFVAPGGMTGNRAIAKGYAYHRTSSLCFCEGEVWNGDVLAAKARATFKYRVRKPAAA